jgi:hypothetical protein
VWKNRGSRVRTKDEEKGRSGIPHPESIFLFLFLVEMETVQE